MIKRLSILLIMSLLPYWLIGQWTLGGSVLRASDGRALAGIELYDVQSGQIVLTDSEGEYRFEGLASGSHEIILFATEYESQQVVLQMDSDLRKDFELKALSVDLQSIDIRARRAELFATRKLRDTEGTAIFAGKRSEVVVMDLVAANLATNNARQIYAQVAGLNIYEGSDGGLQTNLGGRGLDPNRTSNFNTRQNGYDISADVLGYPENYYTPPSEAIQEVRILRGASSLQYGTQFGGLIDFRLRKLPTFQRWRLRSRQTASSWDGLASYNEVGLNTGPWRLNAHIQHKQGDGYRPHSDYDAQNAWLSIGYALSPRTKLDLETTYYRYLAKQAGGLTDQQFSQDSRQSTRDRNWFAVDWKLARLRLDHEFNDRRQFSAQVFGLYASRKSVGFRGNPFFLNENPILARDEVVQPGQYFYPRDLIKGTFRNIGAELRYLAEHSLRGKKVVSLIGTKLYKSSNLSRQGPGSALADADFKFYADEFADYPNQSDYTFPNFNGALFAESIVYLSDRLSITPGLRLEYIHTRAQGTYKELAYDNAGNLIASRELSEDRSLPRTFVLAGVGLSYKPRPHAELIANISQNYRSVTFSDIRVVSPTFIVDPDIRDERGFTADVGWRGRIGRALSYDLTAFGLLYNDRIGIVFDNRARRVRKNIGKAFIWGTETLLSANWARWAGMREAWKLTSFVNMAWTQSQYISSEVANVDGKRVEFIPTINLKAGATVGYRWASLSAQLTHLSEQYTDGQNSPIAEEGALRSGLVGPIPAYTVLDISLGLKYGKWSLDTGINNASDKAYFTRRATGYPGPGIIPSDGRSYYVTLGIELGG